MNVYEKNWNGLWTLEWNEVQGKFHVETADTRFAKSTQDFLDGKVSEWYMLGVFNSYKEASEYTTNLVDYKSRLVEVE